MAVPLWACGGIFHHRASEDVGEERPVGGIAAERDRVRKESSQTGTQTHIDTQTHTRRRDQPDLVSLPRAHAH